MCFNQLEIDWGLIEESIKAKYTTSWSITNNKLYIWIQTIYKAKAQESRGLQVHSVMKPIRAVDQCLNERKCSSIGISCLIESCVQRPLMPAQ
jgi:hypothetical protein